MKDAASTPPSSHVKRTIFSAISGPTSPEAASQPRPAASCGKNTMPDAGRSGAFMAHAWMAKALWELARISRRSAIGPWSGRQLVIALQHIAEQVARFAGRLSPAPPGLFRALSPRRNRRGIEARTWPQACTRAMGGLPTEEGDDCAGLHHRDEFLTKLAKARKMDDRSDQPERGFLQSMPVMLMTGTEQIGKLHPGARLITRSGAAPVLAVRRARPRKPLVRFAPGVFGPQQEMALILGADQPVRIEPWRQLLHTGRGAVVRAEELVDGHFITRIPAPDGMELVEPMTDRPALARIGMHDFPLEATPARAAFSRRETPRVRNENPVNEAAPAGPANRA